MRGLKGFLVVLLVFSCLMFGSAVPTQAAMQDWLPSSDSWLGRQFLGLTNAFKGFITTVKEAIESAVNVIRDFFLDIWDKAKQLFLDIWDWFKSIYERFTEWIGDWFRWLWDMFEWSFEGFCSWLLDWFWWYLKYSFDLAVSYADWLVETSHEILFWILDMLPPIELPEGFEKGLEYFVSYGMILNKVLPIKEMLMFLELWCTIFITMIVHNFVKGWWRWIGWFNK